MSWDQVEHNWGQFRGSVQEKWGDLTEDEIEDVKGRRKYLVGKIQEKYGIPKQEAERQVDAFAKAIF
jgi:uncharacterized protein YjbJ (UPF0337 family)